MASWNDVVNFLNENYTLDEDDDEDIPSITFDVGDNRIQTVMFIPLEDENNNVWLEILSPIGKVNYKYIDDILEYLERQICGGLVKIKENYYIRHTMPIDDLSTEELVSPMEQIALIADVIEEKFVGEDNF